MKKFISIIISVMMLSTLAVGTSAAGEILFQDGFTNGFLPANWIVEGNLFFLDDVTDAGDPCLAAYSDGVICQMEFRDECTSVAKRFTNCAMSTDVQVRDFDRDGDHKVGLWWRDDFYHDPNGEEAREAGEIWNFQINFDDMTARLEVQGEEGPRAEAPVSGIEVGGDWFNMGWKIVPGNISCYVDGEKVIDYASDEIAAVYDSPILLMNDNLYVAFDNITIATLDYDLFGEGETDIPGTDAPVSSNDPADSNEPADSDEPADSNEPADSDEPADSNEPVDSNAPADSDTPANTNNTAATNQNKPQGGNSATTGDASFVVIAVMVATLGCAAIVKKVNAR